METNSLRKKIISENMLERLLPKYGRGATLTGTVGENLFKIEVIWFA